MPDRIITVVRPVGEDEFETLFRVNVTAGVAQIEPQDSYLARYYAAVGIPSEGGDGPIVTLDDGDAFADAVLADMNKGGFVGAYEDDPEGDLRDAAGNERSGNYGHEGRPGQRGGSMPGGGKGAQAAKALEQALTPRGAVMTKTEKVGGGHVNKAFHVTLKDGHEVIFKPAYNERTDIHEHQMTIPPSLAEREVVAAKLGQALGWGEMVPDGVLEKIGTAPPEPPTPPNPEDFTLRPPSEQTPPPEHSGVIATTVGGLNANQKLDAWGRPVYVGKFDPLVEKTPTASSPSSVPVSEHSAYGTTGNRSDREAMKEVGAAIDWQKNADGGGDPDSAGNAVERAQMAVFDIVIGNMDRHGNNYMTGSDGHLIAVDHGYTFPSPQKAGDEYGGALRSFIMGGGYWGGAPDYPKPGRVWEKQTADLLAKFPFKKFLAKSHLSEDEIRGVENRVKLVVKEFRAGRGLAGVAQHIRISS